MSVPVTFLDLPVDILILLFDHLEVGSFLALTSTCRALHSPQFLYDPQFWSRLTRSTFRVANQPVVQNDGLRWQKLFKRLFTQSRIYTWGNNDGECLGQQLRQVSRWPAEMQEQDGLGVIADLQCGGWSTTMLTSKGAAYIAGALDNNQFPPQRRHASPAPLSYPAGFVNPVERYDPATALTQFSTGRSHVLGLSDSGRIWSWNDAGRPALHVRFIHVDTRENRGAGIGAVRKVVAGWGHSAALITGSGIICWEVLQREQDDAGMEDAALVLESAIVPSTRFRQTTPKSRGHHNTSADEEMGEAVGEVINFIVLESFIIFNTHIGKAFASEILWGDLDQRMGEPFEIEIEKSSPTDDDEDATFVTDVQGSFQNFAVFTRDGSVLTSNQDRLREIMSLPRQRFEQDIRRSPFKRIPALQHRNVISLAFGDYHFHALHSTGHITSYGKEPQGCGALGLGCSGRGGGPEGRLRGIRYLGIGGDGVLVPHAYAEGRRVWFDQERKVWVKYLTAGGADPEEAAGRIRMALGQPPIMCQGEVSEWVEQESRDWEVKFQAQRKDDDGLGAYFALSVAAAGWHSGAVVLVNEDLAERVKNAVEVPDEPKTATAIVTDDHQEDAAPTVTAVQPSSYSTYSTVARWSRHATLMPFSIVFSMINYTYSLTLQLCRWFLGTSSSAGASSSRANSNPTISHAVPHAQIDDQSRRGAVPGPTYRIGDHGESPREGYKYVWTKDHFPRLRLSDGTEMPGTVEFDEWRFGRPEFDLDAGP